MTLPIASTDTTISFESTGLDPAWARAATGSGYARPTPVQIQTIPSVLQGRDVVAMAQTGSGKTAAFALPLLQRMAPERPGAAPSKRRTRALVVVPTRELAMQVGEVMRGFVGHAGAGLQVAVAFGGVSINPQMMALRGGAEVVVATPGRLLDLVEHGAISLADVATFVLDEADRLLDLGFADEMARIVALLPGHRQTLMFSATFPDDVRALAAQLLRHPVGIDIAPDASSEPDVAQEALQVDTPRRTALLAHLVKTRGWTRTLVFVATRHGSEHVADKLRQRGIAAAALHGDLGQGARTQVLDDFKAGRLQVLTATDVAARGIDVVALAVVVNYDLPRSAVDYTHRIGRTGRAGAAGVAVSFVTAASEAHFRVIEKRQNRRVPRAQVAGFEPVEVAMPSSPDGGVKGRRQSRKDKLRAAAAKASPLS